MRLNKKSKLFKRIHADSTKYGNDNKWSDRDYKNDLENDLYLVKYNNPKNPIVMLLTHHWVGLT